MDGWRGRAMRQGRSSGRTGRLGEEREELRAAARTHSRASDLRPAHAVWHRRECLERCCRGTAPLGQILRGLVIDLSALIRRHVRPYVLRVTPSMLVPSFLPSVEPEPPTTATSPRTQHECQPPCHQRNQSLLTPPRNRNQQHGNNNRQKREKTTRKKSKILLVI